MNYGYIIKEVLKSGYITGFLNAEEYDRVRVEQEAMVAALRAVTDSLVKTVHKTLPGYPEEQMMVTPTLSVTGVRAILAKAEVA